MIALEGAQRAFLGPARAMKVLESVDSGHQGLIKIGCHDSLLNGPSHSDDEPGIDRSTRDRTLQRSVLVLTAMSACLGARCLDDKNQHSERLLRRLHAPNVPAALAIPEYSAIDTLVPTPSPFSEGTDRAARGVDEFLGNVCGVNGNGVGDCCGSDSSG